jgi:beta-lactamase regulating signal transducer with metallopeptidase domain
VTLTLLTAWLWQGTVLAVLAAGAVRLISRTSASARHAVLWGALLLVVALPGLSWLAHAGWRAPVSPDAYAAASIAPKVVLAHPPDWALGALAAVWMLSVALGTASTVRGWMRIMRVTRRASPLGARELRLASWGRVGPGRRQPAICVSADVIGACAVGLRRPTILVSEALVARLSDEQLDQVILHERAHLDRYDDWSRLLQRLLVVAAGWHPAVRWISRQIDLEMEAACDEWVVSQTRDAARYARCLLDVAAVGVERGTVRALVPAASTTDMPMLRSRIERLVATRAGSARPVSRAALACTATLCAAVGLSTQAPVLVAFEERWALPSVSSVVNNEGVAPLMTGSVQPVESRSVAGRMRAAQARAGAARRRDVPVDATSPVAVSDASAAEDAAGRPEEPVSDPPAIDARVVPPQWQINTGSTRNMSGIARGSAVQQGTDRVTRAAQSTGDAFVRVGQSIASRF